MVKALYTKTNYKAYIDLLKSLNCPYIITRSNYTLKIESSFCNVYFYQTPQSKRAFSAANMIKSDIKKSGVLMPEINKRDLKYFKFTQHELLMQTVGEEVHNIDIKSAYANVLNNAGLLSERTFKFISSIPKSDRLAAVGMMASRKDVFSYDSFDGEPVHTKIIAPTENWFYMCVLEVQNIMQDIAAMIGSDFVFYWVDGIFYKNGKHTEKIKEYLTNKGYNFSYDLCTNFNYFETNNQKFLTYNKGEDFKKLSLPKVNNEVTEYILKQLKIIK